MPRAGVGRCGECGELDELCPDCGFCLECCECDELFDADELGLDPEEDDQRRYGA